jgi:pimeloyl-ACP methyl ester carboxylesterase/DNA-binding CsgD family transcriptional regulator
MATSEPLRGIRYAATRDGAKLAVVTRGSGPPTIFVRLLLGGHLATPGCGGQPWLRILSPHCTSASYDPRGCGLSERKLDGVSMEGCIEELACVLDTLGPEPATLIGLSLGVPVAVQFAALYPQRVARLVLYGGFLRGRKRRNTDSVLDYLGHALLAAFRVATVGNNPDKAAFRRMLNARVCPGATTEEIAELDAIDGRYSFDVALKYMNMVQRIDISPSAALVRCPTLVFHATRDRVVPVEEATRMAAMIPGARLMLLDDDNHMPLESNLHWPKIESELRSFFGWATGPEQYPAGTLTARQVEVLRLVGQGRTDKEIGRQLAISPRTVEMHVAHAMRTLESKTRTEAALQASRRGFLG